MKEKMSQSLKIVSKAGTIKVSIKEAAYNICTHTYIKLYFILNLRVVPQNIGQILLKDPTTIHTQNHK